MSSTIINTNVLALNSHRSLKVTANAQAKSSARLSSGLRVNVAADDAAGLAISEKMRAQIRGLDQGSRNAQDGISMIQTAEGGLAEISNMCQRIRELAVQSSNDSYKTDDRAKIQLEVDELIAEISKTAERVEFNKKKLLNGSYESADSIWIQAGANTGQGFAFGVGTMSATGLGIQSFCVTGSKGSEIDDKIDTIDQVIIDIAEQRAELGAYQNRLEYTVKSLDIASENMSAAESRIRDADMAKEMMTLTKSNVLQQAATAMLSQANQSPQNVLQLLR